MKPITTLLLAALLLAACNGDRPSSGSQPSTGDQPSIRLNGTWRLLTHTEIAKKDSTITDYTKDQSFIKIINDTHFAFLKHRLNAPADSSNQFDAGGGSYTLNGDQYTEHLDYYVDRHWEGKPFTFTVSMDGDTLVQKGLEKVESEGIDRVIIEKYLRVK